MPRRFQRKRTEGWRMPEGAVYVGRPTKWGNQFIGPRHVAVANYRKWMNEPQWQQLREAAKRELRGKDLVCWCPLDQPCHACTAGNSKQTLIRQAGCTDLKDLAPTDQLIEMPQRNRYQLSSRGEALLVMLNTANWDA